MENSIAEIVGGITFMGFWWLMLRPNPQRGGGRVKTNQGKTPPPSKPKPRPTRGELPFTKTTEITNGTITPTAPPPPRPDQPKSRPSRGADKEQIVFDGPVAQALRDQILRDLIENGKIMEVLAAHVDDLDAASKRRHEEIKSALMAATSINQNEDRLALLSEINSLRCVVKRTAKRALAAERRVKELEGEARDTSPALTMREVIEGLVKVGERFGRKDRHHVALRAALKRIECLESALDERYPVMVATKDEIARAIGSSLPGTMLTLKPLD